jgi:hypothetical protein
MSADPYQSVVNAPITMQSNASYFVVVRGSSLSSNFKLAGCYHKYEWSSKGRVINNLCLEGLLGFKLDRWINPCSSNSGLKH